MIDHLLGRPNPSWKRTQVFLVVLFWVWRIVRGSDGPPRMLGLKRANRYLKRFSPWQIILTTLTTAYAMRNLDKILGLNSPEPLARLYSPAYYRATWIATGLDAGFATALAIRPKWLRDICSILFSVYYIIYANEGDEKLRRFRAVPTVEMLRATWEKTSNPYIRLFTSLSLPSLTIRRKILLPRPKSSQYQRPITAYLFYALPAAQLSDASDLILDFPGGGFICMTPEHHEDRLRLWAVNTKKPILSIDYGKAPEYPYPFAIDEAFDTYRVLVESNATVIGMSGKCLGIVLTGDSAGATMACNVVIKTLEYNNANQTRSLKLPLALLLNYAALDFNFASWMTQDNLRILRSEQSSGNLHGLTEQKDHLSHISPLSMVDDSGSEGSTWSRRPKRQGSWRDGIRGFTGDGEAVIKELANPASTRRPLMRRSTSFLRASSQDERDVADIGTTFHKREQDKPLHERVKYDPNAWSEAISSERKQQELSAAVLDADNKAAIAKKGRTGKRKEPLGTRLTLTSRTGYFQDRIVTPSMMRAMALLYVGPYRNPDFATNYHISPLLAPAELLAKFPPLFLFCGEADPFNDDSILLAGRVREAKRTRKIELDLALSGKSARFGENLRMSAAEPTSVEDVARMREERGKLSNEDDWVQLTLFAGKDLVQDEILPLHLSTLIGWSHGYLQMSTLMWEAKAVIEDQADCLDDAFLRYRSTRSTTGGSPLGVTANDNAGLKRTDSDDFGITFVPKRYQSAHIPNGFSTPDKEINLAESHSPAENIESEVSSPDDQNVMPKPTGTSRPQAGHKISETELMRRRRLLDAHIFE
ncbi:alpha/beta-hydrolase [Marasmius fiardii PR-910]|nr:alpha/beta-hydrolase [Marasmius fiardii PR-910]